MSVFHNIYLKKNTSFHTMNKNRIEYELNKKIEQLKILESQAKGKYEDDQDSEDIEQASPRIAIP